MRILYSAKQDPMVIDTRSALTELSERVRTVAASANQFSEYPAAVSGRPAPYDEFLRGMRIKIIQGQSNVEISRDRWLNLELSCDDLDKLCDNLIVNEDGAHNHLYTTPISLIIEADDNLF